jgi:hypothetical protein
MTDIMPVPGQGRPGSELSNTGRVGRWVRSCPIPDVSGVAADANRCGARSIRDDNVRSRVGSPACSVSLARFGTVGRDTSALINSIEPIPCEPPPDRGDALADWCAGVRRALENELVEVGFDKVTMIPLDVSDIAQFSGTTGQLVGQALVVINAAGRDRTEAAALVHYTPAGVVPRFRSNRLTTVGRGEPVNVSNATQRCPVRLRHCCAPGTARSVAPSVGRSE